MGPPPFRFKQFRIEQSGAAHPAGTDGVLLGAWTEIRQDVQSILDIGTGTGLIALMLAQRTSDGGNVQITGVDIHGPSAACATRNFQASPWANRLYAVHADIQDFTLEAADRNFDLIVCNPPFFSGGPQAPDPLRQLVRSTITLKPHILLEAGSRLLAPSGKFCVILPPVEGQRFIEIAACRGLYCSKITSVFSKVGKPVERLLLQLGADPYPFERDAISIYETGDTYSAVFRRLTSAFYLDF